MLTTFPQCNNSLESPEILSQNHNCYHWLSVSGIAKIMHCTLYYESNRRFILNKGCHSNIHAEYKKYIHIENKIKTFKIVSLKYNQHSRRKSILMCLFSSSRVEKQKRERCKYRSRVPEHTNQSWQWRKALAGFLHFFCIAKAVVVF